MQPDIEEYRQYVDRFDLSEEKKIELIHTIWQMMQSFVDMGFGYHPVQLCRKPDLHGIPCAVDSNNNHISNIFRESVEGE